TNLFATMYPAYSGVSSGLINDDISGIRSIYSSGNARSPDAYDAAASNNTQATATNINSKLNAQTLTALVTGCDVTTTSDVDWYKITAPPGGSGNLTVTLQSSGLSLLAPNLRIYNASGTQLVSASAGGSTGATLTGKVSVTAGQTYYIRVTGANSSVFGT